MKGLLVIILPFLNLLAFGQKAAEMLTVAQKFADEDAVYLSKREVSEIKIEGDSLVIYNQSFSDMLMIKENTAPYAEKQIGYSSFHELLNLNPKTLVPNGEKFKEIKVDEIKDIASLSGSVFYDDVRYKKFIFPSLTKGAIARLDYNEKLKEPRFVPPYFFGSYLPVLQSSYSISFPKDVVVSYKLMGKNTDKIKFVETVSKGITTYTFSLDNNAKMEYEGQAPPRSEIYPHVIFFIQEAVINGKKITYLKDVNNLYDWYYSLTEKVNSKTDEELKKLSLELVANKNSIQEKASAIFYWVQNNIKYIAFEAGLEGFVPAESATVYNSKYGDCKGMASIITTMCKYAGIESSLVWIGSRDIAYTYDEVPSPICDNHMIAAVKDNGKWVFLDGTSTYLTYGFPTEMIQGKQAIIGLGKNKFETAFVPIVPKEKNLVHTKMKVKLNDETILGTGSMGFTGYQKFTKVYQLRAMPENKWGEVMKDHLQAGNNKFQILDYKISEIPERSDTLLFNYEFKIPDYIKKSEDEYYINLNLDKFWKESQINSEQRKLSVEMDFLFENVDQVELEIPAGFKVDYLPEDKKFENNDFGFSIHYTTNGNKLLLEKKTWMNTLLIPTGAFEKWNSMIKQLNSAYKEVVVLKKQ